MSTLGERVRQLRAQHRLSQHEFAESIGISQSFLSDIERDLKIPGGETLLSLKRSFSVSLDWLIAGELELLVEGQPVAPYPEQPTGNDQSADLERLRAQIRELERENLLLKGQIVAYRDMLAAPK